MNRFQSEKTAQNMGRLSDHATRLGRVFNWHRPPRAQPDGAAPLTVSGNRFPE